MIRRPHKKFEDKEFIELYNSGISDIKIAKIFKCNRKSVQGRRQKLGLVANFKNFMGKKNNKEKLEEIYRKKINTFLIKCTDFKKQDIKDTNMQNKIYKSNPLIKKKIAKYKMEYLKNNPLQHSLAKKYCREYYKEHKETLKQKGKEYRQRPHIKIKIKAYQKAYRHKNKYSQSESSTSEGEK